MREEYERLRQNHPSAPSFDELTSAGWVRIVWGRMQAALGTSSALRRAPAPLQETLGPLLAQYRSRKFTFRSSAIDDVSLDSVIVEMLSAPESVHHLQCASPEWVAARIWERSPEELEPASRLRFWIDRCNLLSDCHFAPSTAWDRATARAFCESALSVLSSGPALLDWEAFRERLVARASHTSSHQRAELESLVGPVPSTLAERYEWAGEQHTEQVADHFDTCGDLWHLTNYLLAEIELGDPSSVAGPLLALAIERPELLEFIAIRARESPNLVAEMLLHPQCSVLACVLILDRNFETMPSNRDASAVDELAAKQSALADAIAVVAHFVAEGDIAPTELAALLAQIHTQVPTRDSKAAQASLGVRTIDLVYAVLVELPSNTLAQVATCCVNANHRPGLGTPAFAAGLELVARGAITEQVDPGPFVNAYIESLREAEFRLSANGISVTCAVALARLAMRGGPEVWKEFLAPLDIRQELARRTRAEANPYIVAGSLARSLRVHTRLLCRSIVGWEQELPDELVEAVIAVVRAGAINHEEKHRIGAFAARYEHADPDRNLAADLGDALKALHEQHRDRLHRAILETDEPTLLARLVGTIPHTLRDGTRKRIAELIPSEAGRVISLTDVQLRIESLLAAGEATAAEWYIEEERKLSTWGRVPGRSLARVRAEMRRLLLTGDYEAIAKFEPSSGIDANELPSVANALRFYKAVAELLKPSGDLGYAEREFEELQKADRNVAAYGVNLLATRTRRLLAHDLFAKLEGPQVAEAQRVLAAADKASRAWISPGIEDVQIHECNKALLHLAIGQPERAHRTLAGVAISPRTDRIAAYAAVALARMGRGEEATSTIHVAKLEFGDTEVLSDAEAHVNRGIPGTSVPAASQSADTVTGVKATLHDFRQMDPFEQASVLYAPPEPLRRILTDHVRAAAASVAELIPMMTSAGFSGSEDDFTALIQTVLAARLEFLGWTTADQSRGGFTPKENPGERDLVVKKGSLTLAVLEAVVCDRRATTEWTRGELTSHFQKLFAYADVGLYFHLSYCLKAEPDDVLSELRTIASHEAPEGFQFRQTVPHRRLDSRPPGFTAEYVQTGRDVAVAFIVLDLAQDPQRNAAKRAEASNPRRKKSPAKGPPAHSDAPSSLPPSAVAQATKNKEPLG